MSGEAESSPQGSGEVEPIFHRSGKKCSSILVWPEALTFDGYELHLIGYPGIRSPTSGVRPDR